MLTRLNKLAAAAVLCLAAAGAMAALQDIEFPIAELGNCQNEGSCFAYCDVEENQTACHAFAEKHGLAPSTEEIRGEFEAIQADGGPGGCAAGNADPAESCRLFCDRAENIRVCVAYAKDHNLMTAEELTEAEAVIRALDAGAVLPAACTEARACKEVCERPPDVETARQCFDFAEAAGFLPPGVTRDQAERLFAVIESGTTPFKSFADFDQCDDPPTDAIFDACLAVALEQGLLTEEEAELVRATGGQGPGGCRGEAACRVYCDSHQEECFQFAVEHNLIPPEELALIEEGTRRLQAELAQAPPEVAECLRATVGDNVLNEIMTGTKIPGEDLAHQMQACFEEFFAAHPGQPVDWLPVGEPFDTGGAPLGFDFPPEVEACLGPELMSQLFSLTGSPPSDLEAKIGTCFQQSFGGGNIIPPSPPSESFTPPPGVYPSDEFSEFPDQYQQQFESEVHEQFQEQYQQQYQQQFEAEYQRQLEEQLQLQQPQSLSLGNFVASAMLLFVGGW